MRSIILVAALGMFAGCTQISSDGNLTPPSEPISVRTVPGTYEAFAACAYQRLDEGPSVRMTELRAIQTIRIFQEQQTGGLVSVAVRFWDMSVRQTAPNIVEVSIRAGATIYGRDSWSQRIWAKIGGCAG